MSDTDPYPTTITLPDGSKVELRLMSAADGDAALAFARSLPESDLLFLRVDLTDPKVIQEWLHNIETGHSQSIVAYDSGGFVGYATVHRNPTSWTRHLGEVRVNVAPAYRGRGLGRALTAHIFERARGLGLRKLSAHMTSDQHGAQAAFRRLGFVPEALLADYVQDRQGTTHDMVIMSFDIEGHTDHEVIPLRV